MTGQELMQHARIKLYQTRSPERTAEIIGYSTKQFTSMYSQYFGITPEQTLSVVSVKREKIVSDYQPRMSDSQGR